MSWQIVTREDGVRLVEWGGIYASFWMPSRKREQVALGNPFLPVCNVMVNEDERESYAADFREAGADNPIFTHNTIGIPRIRNAIYDMCRLGRTGEKDLGPNAGEHFVVMMDDDVRRMRYSFSLKLWDAMSPETMLPRVFASYVAAADIGTGTFWYQQSPRPQERSTLQPFRLRTWGRGDLYGTLDPELRCDPQTASCEDMDLCLQTLAKHKVLWMDMRYFIICLVGRGRGLPGGDSGVISKQEIESGFTYLARKWGTDVIRIGDGKKRGMGYQIQLRIPQKFEDQDMAIRRLINKRD